MGKYSQFISKIKTILPENTWSWVIAALRQDRLIWDSLQETSFSDLALKQLSSDPTDWSPASLAFLALDLPVNIDLSSLDSQLSLRASQVYEAISTPDQDSSSECPSLRRAGLLAIALWEREQTTHWNSLLERLQPKNVSLWETPVACLFGMVVDPVNLLKILITANSQDFHRELAIHALLSNPLTATEQVSILRGILNDLPFAESASILRLLEHKNQTLAIEVSRLLLHGHNSKTYTGYPGDPLSTNTKQVDVLGHILLLANFNTIASLPGRAGSLHAQALQMTQQIQDNILIQLVDNAVQSGDIDLALATWQRGQRNRQTSGSNTPLFSPPASLVDALLKKERIPEVISLYPNEEPHNTYRTEPFFLLASAWKAFSEDDIHLACELCKKILAVILTKNNGSLTPFSHSEITNPPSARIHLLKNLAQLCLTLNLPTEATQAIQAVVDQYPNDVNLMTTLAFAQRTMGDASSAAMTSHLVVSLTPNNPIARYTLVDNLEAAGDWETALKERESLLENRFSSSSDSTWPKITDLYSVAGCAIRAGHPQRAVEICQQVIQNNPEDGLAHAILGEALNDMGDTKAAINHFQRGTQLASDQAAPWLAFARAQQSHSETTQAIDILQAATLAVENSPIICLTLAEAYLNQNEHTQALKSLREANTLVLKQEKSPQVNELTGRIALCLGQTLLSLGHLSEARQVLETSYSVRPAFPGLAYSYAKALLAMDESGQAIPPLALAIRSSPEDPTMLLDYVQALLTSSKQPGGTINGVEAVDFAQRALDLIPASNTRQQANAKALLAEALAADGNNKDALQAYYRALETELVNDPAWHGRLSLGLGLVAIRLDQFETAIAALQEATRFDTDNPNIYRALAEAYASISLPKEALNSARTALQYAHNNIEVLNWFVDHAIGLGEYLETIAVLTRAIQLDPTNISFLTRLAMVQTKLGKSEAAQETLNQIFITPNPNPEDLYKASQSLLEVGNGPAAITCLERALQVLSEPDAKILHMLANAYRQANKPELALEALDQAVLIDPNDSTWYICKADLLVSLQRYLDAQTSLETANRINPNDPQILYNLALLFRIQGKLFDALTLTDQVISILQKQNPTEITKRLTWLVHLLAAELCRSTLDNSGAQANLKEGEQLKLLSLQDTSNPNNALHPDNYLEIINTNDLQPEIRYGCLSAELALENGEEDLAAQTLEELLKLSQEDKQDSIPPRVLAVKTRLAQHRGDIQGAIQTLYSANNNLVQTKLSKTTNTLAVAMAATDTHNWQMALDLLRSLATNNQEEPFTDLQTARTLVLRAEYQQLCQDLEIITHAPGPEALSQQSFQLTMESLHLAGRHLPTTMQTNLDLAHPLILRWQVRAQVVFQSNPENIVALKYLSEAPEDVGARIAALYHADEMGIINQIYKAYQGTALFSNQHVQFHLAIALGFKGRRTADLGEAIEAIQVIIKNYPEHALPYILLARLTQRNDDLEPAIQAMQSALAIWPNEPRCHAFLANLYIATEEITKGITHLSKAIELEPDFGPHHLALGEAYLLLNNIPNAIRLLVQAQRINPDQIEPYLALARAHIMVNDLAKAAVCAERAIALAPEQTSPLLLRAKIALAADDPRGALNRAQSALRINPNEATAIQTAAVSLSKLDRNKEALEIINKGIPLATNPLPLLVERIRLLEQLQGKETALLALQELVSQFPDEATILAPLAKALAESGQREAAIHTAQKAFQVENSNRLAKEQAASLHQLLGQLLQQSGQLDQAIHEYTETIRLSPNSLELYLELGNLYQERRQHSLAMQTYQQAITIAANDPRPYYQAGLALKESHDYMAAENMLRRAANLARDDVNIHRSLAAVIALNLVYKTQTETAAQSTNL